MLEYAAFGVAPVSISGDDSRLFSAGSDWNCPQAPWVYPSPPMSRPTSPGQEDVEYVTTTGPTHNPASASTTREAIQRPLTPVPAVSDPAVLTTEQSPAYGSRSNAPSSLPFLTTPAPIYPSQTTQPLVPTQYSTVSRLPALTTVGFATIQAEASSSARPARKVKAHVASACVNCKRAHLSCDVQRPCRRCVDAGKEDTCYDVQHKKRGRPRLRDEREAGPSTAAPQQTQQTQQPTTPRPIAQTRSRRAESFRSHQSRGSESSSYGPVTPHSAGFLYQNVPFAGPSTVLSSAEVPTAIVNLDLVIMRANTAFHQAVRSTRSLAQTRLADVVTSADGQSLMQIRNRLREEREQRHPSFLPPIVQSGQDPLDSTDIAEMERFTQGFADSTYYWRVLQDGAESQPFPARVRLAKRLNFYAVVTLPQLSSGVQLQQEQAQMPLLRQPALSSAAWIEQYPAIRPVPQYNYPLESLPQVQQSPIIVPPIRGQQDTRISQDYYSSSVPRQIMPGQPTGAYMQGYPVPAYTHPPQAFGQPSTTSSRLPETFAQPSSSNVLLVPPDTPSEAQEASVSAAEEDVIGEPRASTKRRRMGIDDVLQ